MAMTAESGVSLGGVFTGPPTGDIVGVILTTGNGVVIIVVVGSEVGRTLGRGSISRCRNMSGYAQCNTDFLAGRYRVLGHNRE